MADIKSNIAACGQMPGELEEKHRGKWVLFHDDTLVAVYDSFEAAAEAAVLPFGRGPYLIKQVGAPSLVLPASVMHQPV